MRLVASGKTKIQGCEPEGTPRILDLPARHGEICGEFYSPISAPNAAVGRFNSDPSPRQIESSGTRTRSSRRSSFPCRPHSIEMTFGSGSESGDKLQRETYFPLFRLAIRAGRAGVSEEISAGDRREIGRLESRRKSTKVVFRAIRRRKRSLVLRSDNKSRRIKEETSLARQREVHLQELTLRNWSSLEAIERRNNKPPTLFRIECVFALSRARDERENEIGTGTRNGEGERRREKADKQDEPCLQAAAFIRLGRSPGYTQRRLSITTFYCISISSLSQPRGNSRERPGTEVKLKRMRFKCDYARSQVSARA